MPRSIRESPESQPLSGLVLVPVMPRRSRKTHSNGMSGDASTVWDLPLISNVTMINLHTHPEKWSISTRPMSDKVYQRAARASRQLSCVNDSYGSWLCENAAARKIDRTNVFSD